MAGLLDLDAAARFIQVTPKELQRLVGDGVLQRQGGKFHPVQLVQEYIRFMCDSGDDKKPKSQEELARHLGVSVRSVYEIAKRRGLDTKNTSQEDFRLAYIADLRETAAGRGGEDQFNLTRERARLAKEQADKVARENALEDELKRDVSVLTEVLAQMSVRVVSKLEAIPVRIKRETDGVPREVMQIIEKVIVDVRNEAEAIELDWVEFDEMEEAARSGEDGVGGPKSTEADEGVAVDGEEFLSGR